MKKYILFLSVFCAAMSMAQNKLSVYLNDGTQVEYELEKVDSIVVLPSVNTKEGALLGKFSVSSSKQVQFSEGNLQYQASTNTWRFADSQYDYIGSGNDLATYDYDGWIDLFAWGTSGYNDRYPYLTSKESLNYGDVNNDIAGTDYDWGVYNKISNGGNQAGIWRTLTIKEWNYILEERENAEKLKGFATVSEVPGCLLLPDDFTCPEDLTFVPTLTNFNTNSYTNDQWLKLESAGAVFLPCAGSRTEREISGVGYYGYYWSSSAYNTDKSSRIYFSYDILGLHYGYRYHAFSVRLVSE